jgi:CheY-like chemotaxis protein
VELVEGEPDCSATLAVAFEGAGAPLFQHTSTAEQALAILRDGPVAALTADINLPAMDGLELIRRVRAEPLMAALPVVVTSGDADPATHERALRVGAKAFFPQPYSPFALRQKIKELIRET